MHVDEYRGKQKHEHIDELLELHSKRSATTYFCIQEGLVTIPCRIRCTNSELKKLQARICDCIVDRKELATMRGGHRPNAGQEGGENPDETDVSQNAINALEAVAAEAGAQDYDPTENIEDQLTVFAQGQLETSSLDRRLTVERVTVDNSAEGTKSEQPVG